MLEAVSGYACEVYATMGPISLMVHLVAAVGTDDISWLQWPPQKQLLQLLFLPIKGDVRPQPWFSTKQPFDITASHVASFRISVYSKEYTLPPAYLFSCLSCQNSSAVIAKIFSCKYPYLVMYSTVMRFTRGTKLYGAACGGLYSLWITSHCAARQRILVLTACLL